MTPLSFLGVIHTTPRVGQNAVLRCLRTVIPGADEWGAAKPIDGRFVYAVNRPFTADIHDRDGLDGLDVSKARFGAPVWMRRGDVIDQAISWALAAQTGQFVSTSERGAEPVYRRVDIEQAVATIADQEDQWARQYVASGVRPLTIWYEADVADDPRVAARAILDWWQLDGEPGDPGITRVDSDVKRRWRQLYAAGL